MYNKRSLQRVMEITKKKKNKKQNGNWHWCWQHLCIDGAHHQLNCDDIEMALLGWGDSCHLPPCFFF